MRQACAVLADGCGGGFWRACRRGFCTERRFPAGGSSWECFRLKDKQSAKQIELRLPFSPSRTSASRRMRQSIKSEKQAGLRLHPCQAGLCLLSALSRTAVSCRVRQSIQKRENKQGFVCTPVKPDCACCSCKAGLRLLSGVYDGYGIPPYGRQERDFSCEKIYKSGFPKRRGRGVRPSLRGGYCGSEAGGRIRPPPKQLHTLKIAEHGRGPAFCMPEVRFLHQRRHVCTYGEWLSMGVSPAAAGDVVPTLARTRSLVLRMAERGRGPAFCMPEVRFLHRRRHVLTYGEWQSAGIPSVAVGAAVPTLARTRPNGAGA